MQPNKRLRCLNVYTVSFFVYNLLWATDTCVLFSFFYSEMLSLWETAETLDGVSLERGKESKQKKVIHSCNLNCCHAVPREGQSSTCSLRVCRVSVSVCGTDIETLLYPLPLPCSPFWFIPELRQSVAQWPGKHNACRESHSSSATQSVNPCLIMSRSHSNT